MARQKPEKPIHHPQSLQTGNAATNDQEISNEDGDEEEEDVTQSSSQDSESDDPTLQLPPEELLELGKQADKAGRQQEAVALFNAATLKKCELLEGDELNPEMGEYWMNYGDALFSRVERTESLFESEKESDLEDEDGDDKQVAYESLDAARVCFEKSMNDLIKLRGESLKTMLEGEGRLWTVDGHNHSLKLLKNAVYVRTRLGDFHQAMHEYDRATDEFLAAIRIAKEYGMSYADALNPAIPCLHSMMALDHELTTPIFKLCTKLIDNELDSKPALERRTILEETQEDLQKQHEEYIQNRSRAEEELRSVLKAACRDISGLDPSEASLPRETPPSSSVLNLGTVGKKRKTNHPDSLKDKD